MLAGSVLFGRLGTSDEIAKAVVFLAVDDNCSVIEAGLFADGGMAQVQVIRLTHKYLLRPVPFCVQTFAYGACLRRYCPPAISTASAPA